MDVEAVHHLLAVLFHRLDADVELGGDLLVRVALGDELDDLALARRERLAEEIGRASCRERVFVGV